MIKFDSAVIDRIISTLSTFSLADISHYLLDESVEEDEQEAVDGSHDKDEHF